MSPMPPPFRFHPRATDYVKDSEAAKQQEMRDRDLENYLDQSRIAPSAGGLPRSLYQSWSGDSGLIVPGGDSLTTTLVTSADDDNLFVVVTGTFQVVNADTPGGVISLGISFSPTSGFAYNGNVSIDAAASANSVNAACTSMIGMPPGESGELHLYNYGSDTLYVYGTVTGIEVQQNSL